MCAHWVGGASTKSYYGHREVTERTRSNTEQASRTNVSGQCEVLANVEPATILQSFQQLGTKYPAEVYNYIAETLRRGGEINKEELKKTLGFRVEK